MISIVPRYLEHKSNTKFYEVLIFESATEVVMVKRWGPLPQLNKPGVGAEPIVEKLRLGANTITARIEEEIKPRLTAGKGYRRVTIEQGFHRVMSDSKYEVDNETFLNKLREHYNEAVSNAISTQLGIALLPNGMQVKPKQQTATQRDRGDAWGSW